MMSSKYLVQVCMLFLFLGNFPIFAAVPSAPKPPEAVMGEVPKSSLSGSRQITPMGQKRKREQIERAEKRRKQT